MSMQFSLRVLFCFFICRRLLIVRPRQRSRNLLTVHYFTIIKVRNSFWWTHCLRGRHRPKVKQQFHGIEWKAHISHTFHQIRNHTNSTTDFHRRHFTHLIELVQNAEFPFSPRPSPWWIWNVIYRRSSVKCKRIVINAIHRCEPCIACMRALRRQYSLMWTARILHSTSQTLVCVFVSRKRIMYRRQNCTSVSERDSTTKRRIILVHTHMCAVRRSYTGTYTCIHRM